MAYQVLFIPDRDLFTNFRIQGALLTLADIGIKEISLMGPKNTLYFIESCRYFLQR